MEKLFKKIKDEDAVCKSYVVTEKTRPWPEPLNTIEFMKLASWKLRISSQDAMTAAESLYNKGLLSYPRTETTVYHPTINVRQYVKNLIPHDSLGKYAENI